jgi:DNA polymerase-3 subunit delta
MAKSKREAFAPEPTMRVFLLHGREPFLMRERPRHVVEILESSYGEVEQFRYDGRDAELASILDELRAYGLLQQHKLVVLDQADQFLTGQDSRRKSLENYCRSPVDHATLLLRAETWRPGNLDKLIRQVGLVHKIEAIDEATAAAWCVARCQKRYDTSIEPEAAEALVAQSGPDLDKLDSELDKLASFCGPEQPITTATVAELVGLSREQQAWIIQSALSSGDASAALHTLRELVSVSRQPEQLIGWAVTDLVRKLHTASHLSREGVDDQAIARELRLWGDSRRQVLGGARRATPRALAQLLQECIDTDRRAKRGVGAPLRSLEALTVRVTDTIR